MILSKFLIHSLFLLFSTGEHMSNLYNTIIWVIFFLFAVSLVFAIGYALIRKE